MFNRNTWIALLVVFLALCLTLYLGIRGQQSTPITEKATISQPPPASQLAPKERQKTESAPITEKATISQSPISQSPPAITEIEKNASISQSPPAITEIEKNASISQSPPAVHEIVKTKIPAPQQGYLPAWKVGTTWSIQTQYYWFMPKQVYVENDRTPIRQIQWQFEIVDEDSQQFFVRVKSPTIPTTWMELMIDKPTLSIRRSVLHYVERGTEQAIAESYSGQGMVPYFAQLGEVPYQLPLFPLNKPGIVEYQRDASTDTEIFATKIAQTVQTTDDVHQVQEFLAAKLLKPMVIPDSSQYFIVKTREQDGAEQDYELDQVWAENLPWYLFSADNYSTSWLELER